MAIVTPGDLTYRVSLCLILQSVEKTVVFSGTDKWDWRATSFPVSAAVAWAAERGGGVVGVRLARPMPIPGLMTSRAWHSLTDLREWHNGLVRMLLERNSFSPGTAEKRRGQI